MFRLTQLMPNFVRVDMNQTSVWFSYETLVAFKDRRELVVCENVWSKTTGKHLNSIDPEKKHRYPRSQFLEQLNQSDLYPDSFTHCPYCGRG